MKRPEQDPRHKSYHVTFAAVWQRCLMPQSHCNAEIKQNKAGPEARAGLIIWHLLVGQYTSGWICKVFFYVNVTGYRLA